MSQCTLNTIMGRIASATRKSPIAVFNSPEKKTLECMFAKTVATQRRLDDSIVGLVGIFHKDLKKDKVKKRLQKVINEKSGLFDK